MNTQDNNTALIMPRKAKLNQRELIHTIDSIGYHVREHLTKLARIASGNPQLGEMEAWYAAHNLHTAQGYLAVHLGIANWIWSGPKKGGAE